jgi:hypothetical protein
MSAFVRATRSNQFNESAQQLVNEGINHHQRLKESLSKMRGSRGYNSYFESYTPPLMEDETEENNLNELFVQETLDPRIESVMPILNKLHKKVAEMKEVDELSEWADSLTETELEEGDGGQEALNPIGIPEEEELDENMLNKIKNVGSKVFDKLGGGSEEDLIRDLQQKAGVKVTGKKPEFDTKAKELARTNSGDPVGDFAKGGKDLGIFKEEEVEESGLQAYLGNKKYGKDGMDALRKAGQDHASEKKMQNIRANYSSKEEVAEGEFAGDYATGEAGQWRNKGPKANKPATVGDLVGEGVDDLARILNIAGIKK